MSQRIVFIGAGNLATRLSLALRDSGYEIVQVYSRTIVSAKALGALLQTDYTTDAGAVIPDADLYFVALKDSALPEVLPYINFRNNLVVHCSGSLPMSDLAEHSGHYGVFYPLQTFTKKRKVDFQQIPVFVEGNTPGTELRLLQIARTLSDRVTLLDSAKRQYLHLAAVFACNFVNHFYVVSSEVLKQQDIAFDVLQPLITETASRVLDMLPADTQTGPAVRYDTNIISKHIKLLDSFPEARVLYEMVSESIYKYHNKSDI